MAFNISPVHLSQFAFFERIYCLLDCLFVSKKHLYLRRAKRLKGIWADAP
jgi:hypothetical protein